MITLFGVYLNQLPDRQTLIERLDPRIYNPWRDKHKNLRDELAARASLGGVCLLQRSGISGDLCYNENGRPYFANASVDFNITHTDRAVFLALEMPHHDSKAGECRVGLDAENLARIAAVRISALAERFFTDAEKELFFAEPTDSRFLQIWTKKEALIKWLGDGLRSIRAADTVTAREIFGVEFRQYRVEDTVLALCYRQGEIPSEDVHMLSAAELFEY